jgi:hypothetical protein
LCSPQRGVHAANTKQTSAFEDRFRRRPNIGETVAARTQKLGLVREQP